MTAAPPESQGTGGVSSLEVRWIFPGDVADAVAGWVRATGLPVVLRGELDAAAALVFALARLVGWNWVWVTPGPMRRGCAGSHPYCGARNLKAIRWPTFERTHPYT